MKSQLQLVLLVLNTATIIAQNELPPPLDLEHTNAVFKVVENQPLFPGCEASVDKKLINECSQRKMDEFISENLNYANIANNGCVEGTVYVKFIVEKDGAISNGVIVRDIGAGCGQEALRIIQKMPKWLPGKQRGHPVRVQVTVPIKFELKEKEALVKEEIFIDVELPPLFPGCDQLEDFWERKKCADFKMLQFIYSNTKYPAMARDSSIDGTVHARFVVEKNGAISNATIVRGIGGGCDEEVLRVLKSMPKWNPGLQNGVPVRAYFNFPVKFQLE
jgi:TonB family protein